MDTSNEPDLTNYSLQVKPSQTIVRQTFIITGHGINQFPSLKSGQALANILLCQPQISRLVIIESDLWVVSIYLGDCEGNLSDTD